MKYKRLLAAMQIYVHLILFVFFYIWTTNSATNQWVIA